MTEIAKYLAIGAAFLAVYVLAMGRPPGAAGLAAWRQRLAERFSQERQALEKMAPRHWRPRDVEHFRLLLGLGGGLLGFVLLYDRLQDPAAYLMILVFAGLGYVAPRWVLAQLAKQRLQNLENQLPDVLDLIANSLRAGLSLVQALEIAAREAPKPASEEFTETLRECRLGSSPEEALKKMQKRWPSHDLELFVVAAGVSLRTGGNLAEVASRITETVRERFRLKRRIAALTSQGKMSGWVVGLLPLGLLIGLSFLDPDLMAGFLQHPIGWVILGGGLLMELLGAFFIYKIVSIEA